MNKIHCGTFRYKKTSLRQAPNTLRKSVTTVDIHGVFVVFIRFSRKIKLVSTVDGKLRIDTNDIFTFFIFVMLFLVFHQQKSLTQMTSMKCRAASLQQRSIRSEIILTYKCQTVQIFARIKNSIESYITRDYR